MQKLIYGKDLIHVVDPDGELEGLVRSVLGELVIMKGYEGDAGAAVRVDTYGRGGVRDNAAAIVLCTLKPYGIAPLTGRTIPPGFVKAFLCIHK